MRTQQDIRAPNNLSNDLSNQFSDVGYSISREISMYQTFKCPLKITCGGDCSQCDICATTLRNRRLN